MSVKTDLRFLWVLDKHAFPKEATSKYSFCKSFFLYWPCFGKMLTKPVFGQTYTYAREIILKSESYFNHETSKNAF